MDFVHIPVLLEETIQFLAPRHGGELMVDATLGEGGHSYAFLSRFPELRVIGVEADRDIQEAARERLRKFGDRIHFYMGWSQDFFAEFPPDKADTILIDLGISLYHYEKGNRGFSFRKDEALDMRIDRTRGFSAADLIAHLSEKDLADLLYNNGRERYSRRIARNIGEVRSRGRINSSGVLAELVVQAVPATYRYGHIHPATRTFQALRIAVNHELEGLPLLLEAALKALKPGGRMGVISFHSLEDRIVKFFFQEQKKKFPEAPLHRRGEYRSISLLSRKGITPQEHEIQNNPPSRSARLRVVEKHLHGRKEG